MDCELLLNMVPRSGFPGPVCGSIFFSYLEEHGAITIGKVEMKAKIITSLRRAD